MLSAVDSALAPDETAAATSVETQSKDKADQG